MERNNKNHAANSRAGRLLPDPHYWLRSYKDETDLSDDDGAPTQKKKISRFCDPRAYSTDFET